MAEGQKEFEMVMYGDKYDKMQWALTARNIWYNYKSKLNWNGIIKRAILLQFNFKNVEKYILIIDK